MIKLSSLIGKPVLCLASSCISGSVADVYFDEYCKKAVYFCIDKMYENGVCLLPVKEAASVSDAVVIADEVPLVSPADVDMTAMRSGLKDMAVYSQSGAFKGDISNVLFTNAGKVQKLVLPEGEFTPQAILSIGEVIILKSAVKAKRDSKKRTIPRPKQDYPVHILNDEQIGETPAPAQPIATQNIKPLSAASIAASMVEIPTKPAVALSSDKREPVLSNSAFQIILDGSEAYSYDDDAHTPTRVICDYEFLLGRTLGADLRTYSGELIANEGCVVTDMIVDKARRAGKLVELTLNSVKPTAKN